MDLQLDKSTFKALSSDMRIDAMKLLQSRRHTQSELASRLGISAPTMKEHLAGLQSAGLIERFDEGRKWKYFALTKKGKGILAPEQNRIWLILGMWLFSIAGGIVTYLRLFQAEQEIADIAPMMAMKAAPLAPEPIGHVASSEPQLIVWVFVVASIILSVMLVILLIRSFRYKKELGKHLSKK